MSYRTQLIGSNSNYRTLSHIAARRATPRLSRLAAVIFTTLAGNALLFAPEASAQSLEALQSENQRLQAEVALLKQALGLPAESAAPALNETHPQTADIRSAGDATAPAPTGNVYASGDALLLDAVTVKSEQIKERPDSISAVTGEELEKFHVNNFRDIVNRIGNVRTSWQNPNTASIFIRGVGWAAGAGVLDPSVGVTVDGVSHGISSISALSNYLDLESVEVVRGPTGIDGGKASNVGRVTLTTHKPSFIPEARATVTLGQLNSTIATAVVGGGIVDDVLAYRLTVNRESADGPYENKNDSHYTWRNTDRTNVRAQFLFTPNDRLEANVALDVTPTGREICENCFWFRDITPPTYDWIDPQTGALGKVDYAEDALGKIQRRWFRQKTDYTKDDYYAEQVNTVGEYPNTYETRGATANVRYTFNERSVLSSITGYRDYAFSQGAGSHTQFEWLREPRGTQTTFKQFSQELKLDAELSDSLTYQGGLFYFRGRFPNYSQTERYGSDGGAWYANAAQYATLDPTNPALPNAVDPAGRLLLFNSIHGLITQRREKLENDSSAIFSNLSWKPTEDLTLDAGLRISRETRNATVGNYIQSDGYAGELNPAAVNNVTLNGFITGTLNELTAANSAAQLALADLVAQKYFGIASYSALNATQLKQVAAARALRAGRIGGLFLPVDAKEYADTLFNGTLGASYRVNDGLTVYGTVKHGEKPGVSQIVGATRLGGRSVPADSETTNAYELGFKALTLDNSLSVAGTFFLQNIKDYIQPTFVFDEAQTQLNNNGQPAYLSALGNVPKVRTRGFELDVAYFGIPYTTLRFAGAYTDARYISFPLAPNPGELGGSNPSGPYYDASGKTLPGAPKLSGNLFGDFSYPLSNGWAFHSNLNYNFQSSYYADTTLSRHAKTDYLGVTDFSVGVSRQDGRFGVSLIAKNVFDVNTGIPLTWDTHKPGIPRWIGITFQASLY